MDFPGEKLVIKLWETLVDKPVSALLRPRQILREGVAVNKAKRDEILMLAQAEVDAERIKSGKSFLLLNNDRLKATSILPDNGSKHEPTIDVNSLHALMNSELIIDKLNEDINVSKAILNAEKILLNDSSEPPNESIDDDWLERWRYSASRISNEKLSFLWGQVLAGEIRSPGSFSLRTLNLIKDISQSEATLIEKMASICINNRFIYRRDEIANQNLSPLGNFLGYEDLFKLEELGIISGADGERSFFVNFEQRNEHVTVFTCNEKVITVLNQDGVKPFKIGIYLLTSIGKEIVSLCDSKANLEALLDLANKVKSTGVVVTVWDKHDRNGCYLTNPRTI
ncbi:DUF2806 domain-containing protein [Serratia ficaria]|uniref:DUF2806 domain-containing protein n=1 Tax=Serratia ficaria TaxID=61651 RepID=UPI0021B7C41C|nr:DUF2806 domain-containing protein [Serratia ficaria]